MSTIELTNKSIRNVEIGCGFKDKNKDWRNSIVGNPFLVIDFTKIIDDNPESKYYSKRYITETVSYTHYNQIPDDIKDQLVGSGYCHSICIFAYATLGRMPSEYRYLDKESFETVRSALSSENNYLKDFFPKGDIIIKPLRAIRSL